MAIDLTAPVTRPDLTQGHVRKVAFSVPVKWDAINGKMVIDKDRTEVRYEVITYNANGEPVDSFVEVVPFAGWPQAFVTASRDMYALVEQDANNKGLVGSGTAEPLE